MGRWDYDERYGEWQGLPTQEEIERKEWEETLREAKEKREKAKRKKLDETPLNCCNDCQFLIGPNFPKIISHYCNYMKRPLTSNSKGCNIYDVHELNTLKQEIILKESMIDDDFT